MNEERQQPSIEEVPEVIVTARGQRGIPLVWVVPLVALLIGLALVWHNYMDQGPTITIHFDQAEGVEAGKTRIKYRDVVIGLVESVHFSEDFSEVIVTAQMDKGVRDLLVESTRFWVVRARLGLTRASGLDTLVSGVYIRCPPWRAKRRRVVPGSREATRDTRRAEGAKGDPKGASERDVQSYGRPVCSRNELAMLWRNAG